MSNLTNFSPPKTPAEAEAFNEGLALELYREKRDRAPQAYTPPVIQPKPEPSLAPMVSVAAKVGVLAVSGTAIAAGCYAVASGIAAFVAAYAVQIGAVALGVVSVALAVSATKSDSTEPTNETSEAKQTIINIHVAADGGRVEVNK
jgi:hypothetical protein